VTDVSVPRTRAIDELLAGLIDYAGLFPPAALGMRDAVRAYARYRDSAEAWALGRFVVPVARLVEFSAEATELLTVGTPWRLSVLAGATDAEVMERFNRSYVDRAIIDSVEAKATTVHDVAALSVLQGEGRLVYVEIPLGASTDLLVDAIAAHGMRAKVRTGGVTVEAFPAAQAVAQFLSSCARAGIACKATAGLHHPVRGEYRLTYAEDAAAGTMFGFLNVICASMLMRHGLPMQDAVALLEERDPKAFQVDAHGIRWRDWCVPVADIHTARAGAAHSFGSCSFEEPIHDLKQLAML